VREKDRDNPDKYLDRRCFERLLHATKCGANAGYWLKFLWNMDPATYKWVKSKFLEKDRTGVFYEQAEDNESVRFFLYGFKEFMGRVEDTRVKNKLKLMPADIISLVMFFLIWGTRRVQWSKPGAPLLKEVYHVFGLFFNQVGGPSFQKLTRCTLHVLLNVCTL
jgi:hypothetical protein